MAKRKLNSSSARSRKKTKLDGPQGVATGSQAGSPRTRRAQRSPPPPPPRSLSPTNPDAGQHEGGSKRKRIDDSNQDSSNAPAAKRARSSQSLGEPTSAEAGPSRPQSGSAEEIIGLNTLSPRTRAYQPMETAEPEEESSDSDEFRFESPASHKPWPDHEAGPSHGPSESESDSDEPRELRRPRTPQRPRDPLTSPPPSPPPASQQQQQQMQQYSRSSSSDRTDIVDKETMAAWAASVISASQLDRRSRQRSPSQRRPEPVPPPAETRPMATDRVSRKRGRRSQSRSATPPTAGHNPPPLQQQSPKKKKAKKGKTQDQEGPSSALVDEFVRSRRSTRRDKGRALWCLADNGAARPVASKR